MKLLEMIHLVQFSFFEAESFHTRGNLTLLGPNGVGKTSILDAIQIAVLGAHGTYLAFNAQSVSSQQKRTLKDYCLGAMRASSETQAGTARKRDHAQSYISLVFRDSVTREPISAGVCLSATVLEPQHRLRGLYVVPGVELTLQDHLQAVDEGTAPLEWSAFEVELQRRAKVTKRTAHVSVHPESYIEELLHSLQPTARHIDRHAFVRAFKKSMQLKDIESVNDFVRDYLIDAQAINKQAALTQINRFRQLKTLVQETEDQIDRLSMIRKDHDMLLEACRRRDTVIAVKALLTFERAERNVQTLTGELAEIGEKLSQIGPKVQAGEQSKLELTQKLQNLIAQIAADPSAMQSGQNKKLRETLQARLTENQKRLSYSHLLVREALHDACVSLQKTDPQTVRLTEQVLEQWEALAQAGHAADPNLLRETLERFGTLRQSIVALDEDTKREETESETSLKSLLGQAKAVSLGAGKLSASTGMAIEVFREHGIEAQPICALIEIRDRTWQGTIEAFLGRHRESLVVEPGKEREAVRLLRKHGKLADWLFDVTVVQPMHLDIARQRSPAKDTVSSLVSGSSEIAVTYVRQIFGGMRCVETEEELERHARSLTRDGMLSANGGTRRLRLPDLQLWLIGSKLSDAQQRELHQAAVQAHQRLNEVKGLRTLLEKAHESIRRGFQVIEPSGYVDAAKTIQEIKNDLAEVPSLETLKEPDYLVGLRKDQDTTRKLLSKAEEMLTELKDDRTRFETQKNERSIQLDSAKSAVSVLDRDYRAAAAGTDFDSQLQAKLYAEITESQDEDTAKLSCEEIRTNAERRAQTIQSRVLPTFQQFLDHYNVALIDERSDWRKAKVWTEARISKLQLSELVTYKQEADDALKAAEEAFRRDVAYRLREAIQRLNQGIQNLNKILATCPVFSSNERYQFVAKPADLHRKVYEFILHIDDLDEPTGSLLFDAQDARSEVLQLLEASASPDGKRVQNPLEDYRLLFNFDLAILQDGKEVDRLSKRIGVASNGEHRVPFYVIAGAALAAAYRIAPGKQIDGAALMLLDEAFYGMDSQNCFAAAEFLRSLGLQLIMAGPEADQGKLLPVTNTLYEMIRYGGDVFFEHEHFSEEMQRVMTSDMPMLYPELIDETEQRISATTP